MGNQHPQPRHPELVSGPIVPHVRSKRRQPQPHRQVRPMRVALVDQVDFPRPVPVLELLLAGNCGVHVAKHLEVHKAVDCVAAREPRQRVIAMLPQPRDQIGSDADVERAEGLAREDIDAGLAFLPHGPELGARWTLKQVQGDELNSEWPFSMHRHAELVSASIVPHFRISE